MSRTGKFLLVGCSALLILLVLAVAAAAALLGPAAVRARSLLVLELSGSIEEEIPVSPLTFLLEGRPDTVLGLRAVLRSAAHDPRVSALLVKVSDLDVGLAKADELRDQIRRFRDSGKPAAAYLESSGTIDYYVASACGRVVVAPEGMLLLRGVMSDVPYLRGTLDRLRVEPDFVAIGRYKTAPESLTRPGMSPAQREVVDSVLDQAFARLRDGIAEARGLEPKQVAALIDRSLFRGAEAVEAGLADEALYEDQVIDRLGEEAGGRLNRLQHRAYRKRARSDLRGARVAVVYATGEIHTGRSGEDPARRRVMGSETVAESLREVREDGSVRAVVLRVDSPGGSSTASDAIWREVTLTREKKPVVVSMSDLAASGGYWIAVPASRVVAHPLTLTGSIGVFAGKLNFGGLYRWVGVNREVVKRGANADLFSSARAFSPAQRALLRRQLEGIYREFVSRVASGRGLESKAVEAAAQGRVWTGAQARERGLVDVLGGFDRALDEARQLAGLAPDAPLRLEFHPREKGVLETLLEGDLARAGRSLRRLSTWLQTLSNLLEGRGIQAFDPGPQPVLP